MEVNFLFENCPIDEFLANLKNTLNHLENAKSELLTCAATDGENDISLNNFDLQNTCFLKFRSNLRFWWVW